MLKKNDANTFPRLLIALCMMLVGLGLNINALEAQENFETPPTLKADAILEPDLLKGQHYTIADEVKNDGFFNHYTVTSPFGDFTANTTRALKQLVHEIEAIATMKTVDTDDTVVKSVKDSGVGMAKGVGKLITNPLDSVKGAAKGAGKLVKRTAETGWDAGKFGCRRRLRVAANWTVQIKSTYCQ